LQLKACWNSDMFMSTPFTRQRPPTGPPRERRGRRWSPRTRYTRSCAPTLPPIGFVLRWTFSARVKTS
jgi:hypothetical protein